MVSIAVGTMNCSTYTTMGFDDWSTTVASVAVGRRSNITYVTSYDPNSTAACDFNTSIKYGQDYDVLESDTGSVSQVDPPKKANKIAFYDFLKQPNRVGHLIPGNIRKAPAPVRNLRTSVFNSRVCRRRDPAVGAL